MIARGREMLHFLGRDWKYHQGNHLSFIFITSKLVRFYSFTFSGCYFFLLVSTVYVVDPVSDAFIFLDYLNFNVTF